jgi:CheY-like chemotaxis protein
MPVMDGYTATRRIRKWEGGMRNKEKPQIPIIAMTAHAMAGDEEKSLQAGMNGHVTKPIDPDQLFATLGKWIRPGEKESHAQAPQAAAEIPETQGAVAGESELPETMPEFDLAQGLKRLRGNRRLYRKLLLDFGNKYGQTTDEIRRALDAKDFHQAHSLIHNIKGLAGNLAATNLQAAALEMEQLVKGKSKKAPSKKALSQKFRRLEDALSQALQAVRTLGPPAEETVLDPPDAGDSAIPADLAAEITARIRDAAEMGDVTTLNAIAEEIKKQSDACIPLSKRIVQLAEDFDFDGISKLATELDR